MYTELYILASFIALRRNNKVFSPWFAKLSNFLKKGSPAYKPFDLTFAGRSVHLTVCSSEGTNAL